MGFVLFPLYLLLENFNDSNSKLVPLFNVHSPHAQNRMYKNNNQNIMKISPSIPSSSSSSSLSSSSSGSFFASMLRRFLFCSNSLLPPTSPAPPSSTFDLPTVTSSPCLVARLMGLDSLPPPPVNSPPTPPTSSIIKSWSMNSLEFRRLAVTESTQGTLQTNSFSFREREEPNYVELEDDHFFILSFEKKMLRSKLGYAKLKPGWKIIHPIPNNKENRKGEGETETNSENWSPVSVLLDADHELTTTSSHLSTPVNEREELESVRKVEKNFKLLMTSPTINLLIRSSKRNNKWCKKKRKMWNEIGRISEEEMAKSRWDYGEASNLQQIEEIGDYITGILLRDLLQDIL